MSQRIRGACILLCANKHGWMDGWIHGLSNRAIFNDLQRSQTQISRSGHCLTLNTFEMAKNTAIVTMEGE